MIPNSLLAATMAAGLIVPDVTAEACLLPRPAIVRPENLDFSPNLLAMPVTLGMFKAGPPPPDPLISAYTGTASSTANASSYSFSSVPIGTASANRYVVVYVYASQGASFTSGPTVGGNATSQLLNIGSGTTHGTFFITNSPVTSGTTATVAFTTSATCLRAIIYVWSVVGTNPVLHSSGTSAFSLYSIPKDSSVLAVDAFVNTSASSTATWPAVLNKHHQTWLESNLNISAASNDFSTALTFQDLSPSWSPSGSGNFGVIMLKSS